MVHLRRLKLHELVRVASKLSWHFEGQQKGQHWALAGAWFSHQLPTKAAGRLDLQVDNRLPQ